MGDLALIILGLLAASFLFGDNISMSNAPTSYDDIIHKYAAQTPRGMAFHDFVRLIKAVITKESSWRPSVIGVTGDIGLMQINPANGPAYGVTSDELLDPDTNIRVGVDILRWSINQYGIKDGLAAYNGGPAKRHIDVTQRYASSVLDIYNSIT